jgi:hypothetical protein
MSALVFDLLATECCGWPWIRILIDGRMQLEQQLTQEKNSIIVELDLPAGAHMLTIERFNKTDQNTIVDVQGTILQDQAVTLDNIWFDNVDLPREYLWRGEFNYNNQTHKSVLCWGPNGHWSWPFETPILPWLVNIKNDSRRQAFEILIPTPQSLEHLKTQIKQLQDAFRDI